MNGSDKADNPPAGQCQQCWRHAYDRTVHAALDPFARECPGCVDHMRNGHPEHMIVK